MQNANIDNQNIYSFNYEQLKWIQHTCPSTCTVVVEDGQQVVQHPQLRRAHSCVVHDRTMCMVAGRNDSDEFLGDIWMFDLHEKIWRKYPHAFLYEISFHASAVTPHGCMYVFGGTDSQQLRTNKLHKMWLCAPSLKEQAWMKIVRELQKVERLTKESLIELDVPTNFHHRLNDTIP